MKKFLLLSAGVAIAAAANPAAAQSVTGTVNVTGSVAGRCSVVAPGGSAVQTFSGTIGLGQLDEDDGTLKSSLEGTTAGASGGTPVETRVVCTSASVNIDVTAETLANGTRGTAPASGYANEINYTAEMQVALASGSSDNKVTFDTATAATATKTVGRLAASGNNVTVKAYGFATKGGASGLLVAGDYTSTITVNVAPSA
ncbi:hypothetical protein GGQ88_001621 [Novosphingobium hassiacum]|uniref:DUF4402 domain-containing protein n=1 Tax=Novosphingobium hassiacum TaxID=173676 RepID=A0A7W5ZZ61_9SPHN|nr:hypothetical protein [Novosphingobium hassiacum]MBB3860355.1 hypothetical protein [Novosphingobium hassiacum]